ncbi:MAG: enoyl-CoA hydratase/isomerase family protein [Fimbriimonadaceae bacterium]|nr:enoyl-CoA hydratase/isomerase family protein [Fimbriimonadaceae bacterium]
MASQDYSHWPSAKKVVVIGAGTMGSGIAAHLANIGFDVSLLDLTQDSVDAAFERARSAKPPHFYVPGTASKVRLGSIQENLDWVSDADWVCEAIIEKMDAKKALFEKLDSLISPSAMISTNTSGLQIGLLAEGRSASFRERFLGTHFFNPPRYLKLLELIPTDETAPEAVEWMTRFLEERAARRVVVAKDTPGFIANRYGMWAMFHAVHVAEKLQLSVEQVDAITGPFLGRPRSGSFRLNDVVGLDIMEDIARNLRERCPEDPQIGVLTPPDSLSYLLEKGWIGQKAGQGYYRREGKEFLALDLNTQAYRQIQEVQFGSLTEFAKLPLGERIRKALERTDEVADFLREYLVLALQYANQLKEEISHSVQDFDRVMKWGFAWEMGPFEMMDSIGASSLGIDVPRFYDGISMRDFDGGFNIIKPEPEYATVSDFAIKNTYEGFQTRDLGDGVTAVCLTSKMGTVNPQIVREMTQLIEGGTLDRIVLTSEAKCYSAGYDLKFFQASIDNSDWDAIERSIIELQQLGVQLSKISSVAAVFGYTFGGGFELAMGCSQIAAHPESQIGLPEARVGLLPGGAGTPRLRVNTQAGGLKSVAEAALRLSQGYTSANADEARAKGYLRPTDVTVYHPDRLLTEAKKLATTVKPIGSPEWLTLSGPLVGMIDQLQNEAKAKGEMSDHDEVIGDKMKAVFAKATSFEDALAVERAGFVDLCKQGLSQARIKHMIEIGKPLRN